MIVAALMAMFTVGRHTRADEEAGRTELVRAARVGRHAPLLAAVIVSALACAAMALGIGAVGTATGLPAAGSFLLGAAVGACGLAFTGVAAVAVQVSESTRSAYGLVGAVLGIAFVLRAIGDIESNGLVWASPIGWAQAVHPFSEDRWWPLLLCVVATAVLLAVAVTLLDHRDLGAGLLQARPGAPGAGRMLGSPLGLAVRLQRAALLAWAISLALLGAIYGGLGDTVQTLFENNPQAQAFFPGASGAGLVDAYLATIFSIQALLAAAYAVSSVLRARTEESTGRAEAVLATATSRAAWLGSHVTVALVGSGLLVIVSGAGTALVRATSTGDPGSFGRLFAASLAYVPAVWVVAGHRRGGRGHPPPGGSRRGVGGGGLRRRGHHVRRGAELAGLGRRPVPVRLDAPGADRVVDGRGGRRAGGGRRRAPRRRVRRLPAPRPQHRLSRRAQPFLVGGSPLSSASCAVTGS